MGTFVTVNTYAYTVSHITDKMLLSIQRIIQSSGLNPTKYVSDWDWMERGIRKWLETGHLEKVNLEIYNPSDDKLVTRWEFDIVYGYNNEGDGQMWSDPDAIRYAILKAGLIPKKCEYRIVTITKSGRPDVDGWQKTTLRSSEGFERHSIGKTIGGHGIGTSTTYLKRK